jgi:hypothetical protein
MNEFYAKRYKRIWPYFALLCLIGLAFDHTIGGVWQTFADLTLCFNLLPNPDIQIFGVGWFLGLVFLFYIMFPFFTFLINSKKRAWFVLTVAIAFHFIVYYTDIQVLDSVELDKNGFLPKRDLYTYQLKNYLEYNLKKPDYTCMIYFSENRKKLEKEAVKVKGKYKKSKNMVLQVVKPEAFTFTKPQE